MAQNIQERDGRFQLRIKHRLLDRPYFSTFESEKAAIEYRDDLKSYLKRGLVPRGIQPDEPTFKDPLVVEVIRAYEKLGPVTPFDAEMLSATMGDFLGVRVSSVTAEWVDVFVKNLKMVANNSPGTIRKKVGVYGRILDWHIRRPPMARRNQQTRFVACRAGTAPTPPRRPARCARKPTSCSPAARAPRPSSRRKRSATSRASGASALARASASRWPCSGSACQARSGCGRRIQTCRCSTNSSSIRACGCVRPTPCGLNTSNWIAASPRWTAPRAERAWPSRASCR